MASKGPRAGTGTGLDSARLVTQIVKKTNVDPNSIQAFMFGEHGNSMFAAWSCVTVNGLSIDEMAKQDPCWDFDRPEVEQLGRQRRLGHLQLETCHRILRFHPPPHAW